MRYRKEDEADKWLKEHDPYYTDKRKGKRKKVKYPYETPEQEHRRVSVEIPFSGLSRKQRSEIPEAVKLYE